MTEEKSKIVIAIDGPAASGKGTLARKLAERFSFSYLDTGKLYRLVGLNTVNCGYDPENPLDATKIARELADNFRGEYLDNPDLSTDEAGNAASKVAVHKGVRDALVDLQRNFPNIVDSDGVVVDGRDIGTVIFPDADLKLFVTADLEVRAKRRFSELETANRNPDYNEIIADMRQRDERDSSRKIAPTLKAENAIEIDTSTLGIDETLDKVAPQILKLSNK